MLEKDLYEKYIYNLLKTYTEQGKKKFVLYPNGDIAGLAADVLIHRFGINPEFVVDNIKFDGERVFSLEQAEKKTEKDMFYLICSDRDDIYDIIRDNLKRHIKTENIIDLFPKLRGGEYKRSVMDMLDCLDKELEAMEKDYVCD